MIHCEKCSSLNPPEQQRCQNCGRSLLPGTGVLVRIFVLLFSIAIAGLGVFILSRMMNNPDYKGLGCALTSPILWGIVVVVMPISGLVYALKPTPLFERYLDRGKRHVNLDKDQALADFSKALELAPEKERAPILKERAKLLESMGQTEQATRDKIATLENSNAYSGAEGFAALTGLDKDSVVQGMRENDQKALLQAHSAIALGYCTKCKMAVQLDVKSHCVLHPHARITNIHLAVPADINVTMTQINEKAKKDQRLALIRTIVFVVGVIILCVVISLLTNPR